MKKHLSTTLLLLCLLAGSAQAQTTTLQLSNTDFGITSVFNNVTSFQVDIELSEPIFAGGTFINPSISRIDYQLAGVLPEPTPSMFPGFNLVRGYSGDEFYSQSPEATLQFQVDSAADLSDGLQLSDLSGFGDETILFFDTREFNQSPGRYHPPQLTLRADGTGLLQNSNNSSTFPNPDSGLIVDVGLGDEYEVNLSFTPTIASVPEPSAIALLGFGSVVALLRRRK